LVDGNGKIMKDNEGLGEIHIRNSYLMSGYLNNEKATSEAFTADGWIRSGDVGYVKEDGTLLTARKIP
jgi:long-subunit acyl-CoA synthetase (AMP-forming)